MWALLFNSDKYLWLLIVISAEHFPMSLLNLAGSIRFFSSSSPESRWIASDWICHQYSDITDKTGYHTIVHRDMKDLNGLVSRTHYEWLWFVYDVRYRHLWMLFCILARKPLFPWDKPTTKSNQVNGEDDICYTYRMNFKVLRGVDTVAWS